MVLSLAPAASVAEPYASTPPGLRSVVSLQPRFRAADFSTARSVLGIVAVAVGVTSCTVAQTGSRRTRRRSLYAVRAPDSVSIGALETPRMRTQTFTRHRRRANGWLRQLRVLAGRKLVARQAATDPMSRAGVLRASWFQLPFRKREVDDKGSVDTQERPAPLEDENFSPEAELALVTETGPQKVAMLGTRECPFQHQQEIELLTEARVSRGDHVFTSGSSGTNSSVIKGAMKARRPELLTVVLPQSFSKQDKESQVLLRQCMQEGVNVIPMPENDKLPLQDAARMCNTKVLENVKKLVAFASHESQNYVQLVQEAKMNGIMATAFFLD